jgi:Holliday junction resolvase RusA-like endonuclease
MSHNSIFPPLSSELLRFMVTVFRMKKKDFMRRSYVVYGNPVSRRGTHPTIGWHEQRTAHMRWHIELEEQHGKAPLFRGAIDISVDFYFPIPFKLQDKINPGATHSVKPDIYGYFEYVHSIARNFLYSENAVISSLSCRKLYDKRPRTEFTITELL